MFSKENITFILSVFGSIGALYTLVSTIVNQWARIDVSIVECVPAKDSVILYMMFINKSRLPISITNVMIWNRCTLYSCNSVPTVVKFEKRYTPKEMQYSEAVKSIPLPIHLPSLSGTYGYLYFQIPQGNFECNSKTLTVELSTNRHLKLQKTLSLPGN